ncbi:hypothetical protein SKAU_G00342730 [Synaphobranchus kaupii]|uniref:Uncharacterized protein n=1 Tax=Synaphobranchus kaupii TaxID=118154 RepID=A0A9Q1EJ07_SYNKA|nr:hypothetical protein SKAU_G00342730 [Synaphobranchus kaupii]
MAWERDRVSPVTGESAASAPTEPPHLRLITHLATPASLSNQGVSEGEEGWSVLSIGNAVKKDSADKVWVLQPPAGENRDKRRVYKSTGDVIFCNIVRTVIGYPWGGEKNEIKPLSAIEAEAQSVIGYGPLRRPHSQRFPPRVLFYGSFVAAIEVSGGTDILNQPLQP